MENITKEFDKLCNQNLQLAKESVKEKVEGAKTSFSALEHFRYLHQNLTEIRSVVDLGNTQIPVLPALNKLDALLEEVVWDFVGMYDGLAGLFREAGHVLVSCNRKGIWSVLGRLLTMLQVAITEEEEREKQREEAAAMRRVITSFYKLNDEELSRLYRFVKNS